MHANVRRVVDAAAAAGIDLEPQEYPDSTRTAAEAAAAIGVELGQIVKSLVFAVDGIPVVALVSGSNQLDEAKLAAAAGGSRSTRLDADAVRAATGYPIGGIPPFAHATKMRVFVDADLLAYDVVWAAAGTPHVNFPVTPHQLVTAAEGDVADLAKG